MGKMSDEIEVGEYVRTDDGIIFKVDYLGQSIVIDRTDKYTYSQRNIAKHSKNLIDLIEVGDVVEYKENRIFLATIKGTSYLETYITDIHNEEELEVFKDEIKNKKVELISILTKQQYEKNCFRKEE